MLAAFGELDAAIRAGSDGIGIGDRIARAHLLGQHRDLACRGNPQQAAVRIGGDESALCVEVEPQSMASCPRRA